MWELHFRFSSIVIPRYLNDLPRLRRLLPMFMFMSGRGLLIENNWYVDFFTFIVNLLLFSQAATLWRLFMLTWSWLTLGAEKSRAVSSVYKRNWGVLELWCISLIYKRKRRGPRMDPCGTPSVLCLGEEKETVAPHPRRWMAGTRRRRMAGGRELLR